MLAWSAPRPAPAQYVPRDPSKTVLWLPVTRLYEALQSVDPATERSRG